jgi:hypothetical protein
MGLAARAGHRDSETSREQPDNGFADLHEIVACAVSLAPHLKRAGETQWLD